MTLRPSIVAVISIVVVGCAEGPDGVGPPRQNVPSVLTSFVTGSWELRVDRAWNGVAGNVQFPSDTLDESAYEEVLGGPTHHIVVSDEGRQIAIGDTPLRGHRAKAADSLVEYSLSTGTSEAPAGGRLVVWPTTDGLQGELTLYGSGRPIVKSERGSMVLRP
jgi:hypothetical protein